MSKYVYLIQSVESGYYKIGISKNPKSRLKQLQTGNPSVLKIITTFQSQHANLIETTLHRQFSTNRQEGEWFDLSINDDITFISECQKIHNNFECLIESGNNFITDVNDNNKYKLKV